MTLVEGLLGLNLLFLLAVSYKVYTRKESSLEEHIDSFLDVIQSNQRESFFELQKNIHKDNRDISQKNLNELHLFKDYLSEQQRTSFAHLTEVVEKKIDRINQRVEERLTKGLEKTNKSFADLLARLAKIDEAQKKIEGLSSNVLSLQEVLTDKKSRGIFGEVQLNNILSSVFGDKNDNVYKLQHLLSNGKIVDSILFLPDPVGALCVDSKFPLENFKRMFDQKLSEIERAASQKEFSKNMKKHIDDIAGKYIIKGETSDQAILFLPAEAIFAEVHAYHQDIIEYANKKRVWISGPTTFMATLTTVQMILTNVERNKYMSIIHQEINKLGEEFERYEQRWNDLARHLGTVNKDVEKIHTTTQKISGRFNRIMEVDIDSNDEKLVIQSGMTL